MKKDEVLALKEKLAADFQKKSEAIDLVLSMLEDENSTEATPQTSIRQETASPPAKTAPSIKRTRGLLRSARRVLPKLPIDFTKYDVFDALRKDFPDLAEKMKPESLRGCLSTLVDEGLIQVKQESSGTRPAVYTRIVASINDIRETGNPEQVAA